MPNNIRATVHDYIILAHAPDLKEESIPGDCDLLATGIVDSLALLEVSEWLQNTFSISILDMDISPADLSTIDSITDFITRSTSANV